MDVKSIDIPMIFEPYKTSSWDASYKTTAIHRGWFFILFADLNKLLAKHLAALNSFPFI